MKRSLFVFAIILGLASWGFVGAQVASPTPRPPLGSALAPPSAEPLVQVFFEEQCRGRSVRLKVPIELSNNEALEAVGIPGDSIKSLKIPPGVSVTLYSNDGFAGRHVTFTGRVATLGALSRATSSLKTELKPEIK